MLMVAAVLGCRFVREDFIESHVVAIDAIAGWTTNDQVIRIAKVADQSSHSDIDNIVSEATTVGPPARNEPTILEWILDAALQHITAEDAESRIPCIIRITRSTAGQTGLRGGEINLDQIRDVNAGNVSAVRLRRNRRLEDKQIDQMSELRRFRILPEEFAIAARARAAVQILISKSDQSFVEQRIALACNLHK